VTFAIKTEIRDPLSESLSFQGEKTMYGGKTIAAGDTLYIFASETQGGRGLIARGRVEQAVGLPRHPDLERQTPRVSLEVRITGRAREPLGRDQLKVFRDWSDGDPRSELNFKFYRQATNKVVGLSEAAGLFLAGYF